MAEFVLTDISSLSKSFLTDNSSFVYLHIKCYKPPLVKYRQLPLTPICEFGVKLYTCVTFCRKSIIENPRIFIHSILCEMHSKAIVLTTKINICCFIRVRPIQVLQPVLNLVFYIYICGFITSN